MSAVALFSLLGNVVLISGVLLMWPLMNVVGFLVVLLLGLLIGAAFLSGLIWSIAYALTRSNREVRVAAVPVCVNVVGFLVALGL